ncbi:MAG TPA: hypothetical protein VNW46_09060 [Gemmatimonadaceae bacterium]|nr:hypothetical protein [Gemmatimonadaceae bacterium]
MMRRLISIVALVGMPAVATAQSAAPAPADSTPTPVAKASDVGSMDAILTELYAVISGPAGPRDWDRFYSLFAPGARLIPTRRDSTGATHIVPLTPREYAQHAGQVFAKQSFYEHEIGREVNTFGAVTQVFSAYASRHEASDPKPFARGINSIQLFNDGTRWYVVTIYWDSERPGTTIPEQYLHPAAR